MNQPNCFIHVSKLCNSKRKTLDESSVIKKNDDLYITYCENDSLDKFEQESAEMNLSEQESRDMLSLLSVEFNLLLNMNLGHVLSLHAFQMVLCDSFSATHTCQCLFLRVEYLFS